MMHLLTSCLNSKQLGDKMLIYQKLDSKRCLDSMWRSCLESQIILLQVLKHFFEVIKVSFWAMQSVYRKSPNHTHTPAGLELYYKSATKPWKIGYGLWPFKLESGLMSRFPIETMQGLCFWHKTRWNLASLTVFCCEILNLLESAIYESSNLLVQHYSHTSLWSKTAEFPAFLLFTNHHSLFFFKPAIKR